MLIESIFEYNQVIPAKYTCQGENVSPPLKFSGIPKDTKSLALIMDDPDAPNGTFDHWIIWNILPGITELSEGAAELFARGSQTRLGTNHYNETTYRGPCPPPGKDHHYFFKLFALDTLLDLKEKASKHDLESAMEGHIIERTELMGIFRR